jgi:crossover junction endodeoxyribonuclease RusA
MTGTWVVEFAPGKTIPTINAERSASPFVRARYTRMWREAFCALAKAQRIPRGLTDVRITIDVEHPGVLADVAAHVPAVKAAVDGLVDAGVMQDDSPAYLTSETYNQPTRGKKPVLRLTITGTRPCKATTEEKTG